MIKLDTPEKLAKARHLLATEVMGYDLVSDWGGTPFYGVYCPLEGTDDKSRDKHWNYSIKIAASHWIPDQDWNQLIEVMKKAGFQELRDFSCGDCIGILSSPATAYPSVVYGEDFIGDIGKLFQTVINACIEADLIDGKELE